LIIVDHTIQPFWRLLFKKNWEKINCCLIWNGQGSFLIFLIKKIFFRLLFTTTKADYFPVQLELMRNYTLPTTDDENFELGFKNSES